MYDPEAQRFLPDRYVEGTCPHCGYPRARGDQCENCGRTLDPIDLIDPKSRVSGATPELRETQHFFLLLSKLEPELLAWLETREGWRRHVINWSLQFVKDGLHDRAISRDLDLGRAPPHRGARRGQAHLRLVRGGHRLPLGERRVGRALGRPRGVAPLVGGATRPSRTTSWARTTSRSTRSSGRPSCSATATSTCPTNVPANQYVTFKGEKASKSAGVGRTVLEYLQIVQPDALRYAVACVLPEQNDTELTDDEIVRRVNDELVAVWGNLVNRVVSMIGRNFDGAVPASVDPQPADLELVATVDRALADVAASIEGVELRAALRAAMSAAQAANAYLSDNEPWKVVKTDRDRAGTVLHHALQAVAGINVALSPFIPFAGASVAEALGQQPADRSGEDGWVRVEVAAGQPLGPLAPLFSKLDSPLFGEPT